jgi:hypothetical protein
LHCDSELHSAPYRGPIDSKPELESSSHRSSKFRSKANWAELVLAIAQSQLATRLAESRRAHPIAMISSSIPVVVSPAAQASAAKT